MRLDRLKSFALSLPQTTVVKQWGECLVFKIAGRMFLIISLDADVADGVIFKCTPEEFDDLTQIDGIGQAPYCAKRLWVRVADLAALPEQELQARIRRSYDLVVAKLPKKIQALLRQSFPARRSRAQEPGKTEATTKHAKDTKRTPLVRS